MNEKITPDPEDTMAAKLCKKVVAALRDLLSDETPIRNPGLSRGKFVRGLDGKQKVVILGYDRRKVETLKKALGDAGISDDPEESI